MTRVRRNVAKLAREDDWPNVLVDYDRAVGLMRAADSGPGRPVEPTSWRFMAAIHGRGTRDGRTDTSNPMWSSCQHGSWFFLPWHRMYLAAFERIVQHYLEDEDWSLPYWYAIDPDHPRRSVLPAAFRDRSSPGNNLHTRFRSRRVNRGRPIYGTVPFDDLAAGLGGALAAGRYATADGITAFGGGQRSRPSFSAPEQGLLEGTPHGTVHVLVGGSSGWMSSFFTAALDPIFWLHHANLDRLWQVWLDLGHHDPRRKRAWLDTSFEFPAPGGTTMSWRVAEVLDTRELGYEYDNVDAPSSVTRALDLPPPRETPDVDTSEREVVRLRRLATTPTEETELQTPPRVLGAVTDVDISATTPVEVRLSAPTAPGTRTYLRIEGVVGAARVPVYGVFLDVPEGQDPAGFPELWVGSLSTFGVAEASVPSERHDGDGLTVTFDATAVRAVLEEDGRWDDGSVVVSFTPPAAPESDEEAVLDDAPDQAGDAELAGVVDAELGGMEAAATAAAVATTEGLRARRVALVTALTD